MSSQLADTQQTTGCPEGKSALSEPTHALHIKSLPYSVWCRARHNANLSGMHYRDYIIKLLAESQPFPREPR